VIGIGVAARRLVKTDLDFLRSGRSLPDEVEEDEQAALARR
jgi:hypothetical protein